MDKNSDRPLRRSKSVPDRYSKDRNQTDMAERSDFDAWADSYEEDVENSELAGVYPFAGYSDVREEVLRQVTGTQGDSVLDLGIGTGSITARLYALGYRITGLDFSQEMIARAGHRMPEAELLHWDFTQGLPEKVKNEKYDAILLTYSIHHLLPERQLQLITELLDRLEQGGRLIIGDILTETREEMKAARKKDLEIWDDSENYLVVEEIRSFFPKHRLTFYRKSYCSGVLVAEELAEDERT